MLRHEFVVVGRPVSRRASPRSKRRYKQQIREAARGVFAGRPSSEPIALTVRYFHWGAQKIDGDNLLSVIADALTGLAYDDDDQVETHHIDKINMTRSYRLMDPPEEVLDHLEGQREFVWIRVSLVRVIHIS